MVYEQKVCICPAPIQFLRNYLFPRIQSILTITLYSALDFYDLRVTVPWGKHTHFSSEPSRFLLPHWGCPGCITVINCSFLLPFCPTWKVRIPTPIVAQFRKLEERISPSLSRGRCVHITILIGRSHSIVLMMMPSGNKPRNPRTVLLCWRCTWGKR